MTLQLEEILKKMTKVRLKDAETEGVSVGDVVVLPSGKIKRVGVILSDGSYQLTSSHEFYCEKFGDSIGTVKLTYGALDRPVTNELQYVEITQSFCWTWKDLPEADGEEKLVMPFRRLKLIGDYEE